MPDPTAPGWRPRYTGDNSLGDVATDGKRLGAYLYELYRAGRNELPALAVTYASLTRRIHGIAGSMRSQFDRPVRGMDQSHLRLLELRDHAHEVLRTTCLRMAEVGQALVETVNDYAATDQAAADEFSRKLDVNAEDYQDPMLPPPRPPRVDDPPPGSPPPGVQY
jgi:hypothetical protein